MNFLLQTVGIVLFIGLIAFSIALHEMGHMIPAKKFGVKVTEYMIGFGPKIWSRVKGETEYGFKAIPLGGYVKIIGMLPPSNKDIPTSTFFGRMINDARTQSFKEIKEGEEDRVFYKLPVHKRLIVMFGGPFMNFLLAIFLFAVVISGIGLPQPTTTVNTVVPCTSSVENPLGEYEPGTTSCPEGSVPTPAGELGLQRGDMIVSINGITDTSWETFSEYTKNNPNKTTDIVISRDGQELKYSIVIAEHTVPVYDENYRPTGAYETRGVVGVIPAFVNERAPLTDVPSFTWSMTVASVKGLISFPGKLYTLATDTLLKGEERDATGPVSVVGISRLGGEVAATENTFSNKALTFIGMTASLNLFLFLFNLLPILPLDGGHIAGAIYEAIRRKFAQLFKRPDPGLVDTARLVPVAYVVTVLLIGMSLIVIFADLFKPIALNS